jgi:pyruvate kinase
LVVLRNFTKIIATIGPSSDSSSVIKAMWKEGMNVARLNLSHQDHKYTTKVIGNIRKVSRDIAIMLDTKGPEIRTGYGAAIDLSENRIIRITPLQKNSNENGIAVDYPGISRVKKGSAILVDDGLLELRAIGRQKSALLARVVRGGRLEPRRKLVIPDYRFKIPFLRKTDEKDIKFAVQNNFDYIAASFVKSAKDVKKIRELVEGSGIRIIAKVEHPDAIKNIRKIIQASDGVMIARGDLGVEVPLRRLPGIQWDIIRLCIKYGQTVIVATQMLESMMNNLRPTRPEVTDIAQAVIQGADAVMLSGETSIGKYPVQCVSMMTSIIKEYQNLAAPYVSKWWMVPQHLDRIRVALFTARSAYDACKSIRIAAIIAPTYSGFSARKMALFRPKCPIIGFTQSPTVLRQLQLVWGVVPRLEKRQFKSRSRLLKNLILKCYNEGIITRHENVAFISGDHDAGIAYTNTLEIIPIKNVVKFEAKDKTEGLK